MNSRTSFKIYFLVIFVASFLSFNTPEVLGLRIERSRRAPKADFNLGTNGTTYIITSIMDESVITVHPNGDVTTEEFRNAPEQRWTVVRHPLDPDALEFKQEVVPYNMLSGFEDPPENPGMFPRPLGLQNRGMVGRIPSFNIKIRGRWCIQANGYGFPMDMDDCEDFIAPWQLWELEEVS